MIDNVVMIVSGVQQSDSVICIHVSILFQIAFPFKLLHNIELSSLRYTAGPCWLSILDLAVCTCAFFKGGYRVLDLSWTVWMSS